MTLRARLALGLLAITLVFVVPLTLALRALDAAERDAKELRDGDFAASLLLGRMRSSTDDLRRAETALVLFPNAARRDSVTSAMSRVSRLADSLDRYALDATAASVRAAVRAVATEIPRELDASLSGRSAAADSISARHVVPAIGRMERAVHNAEQVLRQRTRARVEQAAARTADAERAGASALLAALLLAAAIGIFLMRSISRPVHDLERGMRLVAEGDFAVSLATVPSERDEFGRLSASFASMTQRLGELERLQAEFVSVASHELKTPINVILGYLQLLEEGVYGPLSDKQHEIGRTLQSQAQSLSRLVKQLLDVSRFEAGGGRIEPRPAPLGRFLDELEQGFHVLAVQRSVEFTVTREPGLPEEVTWDMDRMAEVVGNLLSNAFKFTPRGGQVELRVAPSDTGVLMQVRDTGAGIPPEQLPKVFQKFYQADNQSKASAMGTGLGLAIAKSMVEAHHGEITVDSVVGSGTLFTIALPDRVHRRRSSVLRATPVEVQT